MPATHRDQSPECSNTNTTNTASNLDNTKPDDEADIATKSSDSDNDLKKILQCSNEHKEVYNYWKNFEIQKLKVKVLSVKVPCKIMGKY